MKVNIKIQFKTKDGKQVTLNHDEGRELFERLKQVYGEAETITISSESIDMDSWDMNKVV